MPEGLSASIIVFTTDQNGLEQCLSALLHQDFDPSDYEILVLDTRSNEKMREMVDDYDRLKIAYFDFTTEEESSFENQTGMQHSRNTESGIKNGPSIRYLPVSKEFSKANALNKAWQLARGELIVLINSDDQPAPDWLKVGLVSAKSKNKELHEMKDKFEVSEALKISMNSTEHNFFMRSCIGAAGGFRERHEG